MSSRWALKKMRHSLRLIPLILCVASLVILGLWLNGSTTDLNFVFHGYTVYTEGCKMPDFNPFDESIKQYIWTPPPLECEYRFKPPLTYQDGPWLRINQTVLLDYKDVFQYCQYSAIVRSAFSDYNVSLSDEKVRFKKDVLVKDEFVKVECFSYFRFYRNYHAFIIPNLPMRKLSKLEEDTTYRQKPLNVIMVGVDSVSRLNGIRQLSKTRKYLLNTLHAFELRGYNKIGDNTFLNIVPMTTGKYVSELPYSESTMLNKFFNDYYFMWDRFKDRGYRTFYAEDNPQQAIFNDGKAGFRQPPTDHYLRPFNLAIEVEHLWHNWHHCFASRMETKIVLDYFTEFLRVYKDEPYFAFSYITRLSHDYPNLLGAGDEVYFQFLNNLKDQGHLENSVLLFFSDHGMRWGDLRETYIGKMEERLPMFYFAFPDWFRTKYPVIMDNLVSNSRALTTPFDIYETLLDILNMNNTAPAKPVNVSYRGISLFRKIPSERSCEHATILPHWCTCHSQKSIDTNSDIVQAVANVTLQYINTETFPRRESCAELSLVAVINAWRTVLSGMLLAVKGTKDDIDTIADYQVRIKTMPGAGEFEATIRHFETAKKFQIAGDVSRVNKYGNQSSCITDFIMKKYCFCS